MRLFLLPLIFALLILSAAVPGGMPLKKISKLPNRIMNDERGKEFMCVNTGNAKKAKWQSGDKKKKKFMLDSARIKALKQKKKELKRQSKSLSKKDQKLLKLLTSRAKYCRKLGPIPPLTAADGFYAGTGINPVSVDLSVSGGESGKAYNCSIVSQTQGATVQIFPNCKALVSPKDHVSSEAEFVFYASQEGNNQKSNNATARISWDQSGSFSGDYLSLKPYRESLTEDEAMHLIRWAAYGRNKDEYLALASQRDGRGALINELVSGKAGPACEAVEQEALQLAKRHHVRLNRNYNVTVDANFDGVPDRDSQNRVIRKSALYRGVENDFWTAKSAQVYMLHMLNAGCQPLRERLAMLFQNHFPVDLNTFAGNGSQRDNYILKYINLVRGRVKADYSVIFPSLVQLISNLHGDSAMLYYLDNRLNRWNTLTNENYARELLELFTLAPMDIVTKQPNYIERDIYELSYALTGYSEIGVHDPRDHGQYCCVRVNGPNGTHLPCSDDIPRCITFNSYETTFTDERWNSTRPNPQTLFESAPWARYGAFKANTYEEGQDTLTPYLLNEHPGAARYLSARLMATFAGLDLTNEIVGELAADLKAAGFRIESLLTKILSSSSYFSSQARYDCIASPAETFLSFVNLFKLPLTVGKDSRSRDIDMYAVLNEAIYYSGQTIFMPPNVFGWKECGKITGGTVHNGEIWLTSQYWLERLNGITKILNSLNAMAASVSFSWESLLPAERSAESIVNHFARTIGISLKARERELLVQYLTTISPATITDKNGAQVPDSEKLISLAPESLSDSEFKSYWLLKGPGLLELFFALKMNHIK